MKDTRQLLCTFSDRDDYVRILDSIKKFYTISGKIFVFSNEINPKEIFITYNIENRSIEKFSNTISVHRKKQTNTLYTLNALNQMVKDENDGKIDNNFQINWEHYKNCLIITTDSLIKIIKLKIVSIIN